MIDGAQLEYKQNEIILLDNGELMPIGEIARWQLLLEAIDLIDNEANEVGRELTDKEIAKNIKWHKAINLYIKERYMAQVSDLVQDLEDK